MKSKLIIFSGLTLLFVLSASIAMACNCGKKGRENNSISSCSCGSSCGSGQSVCSESPMTLAQGKTDQGVKMAETKLIEVGNKICPVSGEKILAPGEKGSMGESVKYEYNGKVFNLCCPMCIKDFKNNPEKYSAIAEKKKERNMTVYTCPMHPEVKSDKPGKCPKCGMNLQPEAKKK